MTIYNLHDADIRKTPQQQQEFIITEEELKDLVAFRMPAYTTQVFVIESNVLSCPHTSTPQCPHWGINRIVPNDDNGEYSGFVDSWECCKPNNDTAIRKAERERVLKPFVEYASGLRTLESSVIQYKLQKIIEFLRSEQP